MHDVAFRLPLKAFTPILCNLTASELKLNRDVISQRSVVDIHVHVQFKGTDAHSILLKY